MKNYPLWKSLLVIIIIFLGIVFSIPSFLYKEDSTNWFLNNKINLGLDLQGGSYLLLEVQSEVLFKEELDNISDSIRLIAREVQINLSDIKMNSDEVMNNEDHNIIGSFSVEESGEYMINMFVCLQQNCSGDVHVDFYQLGLCEGENFEQRFISRLVNSNSALVDFE